MTIGRFRRPVLKGTQGARRRHRQRAFDRLRLRQGVPRARRRSRDHLSQRQGAAATSSRWRRRSRRRSSCRSTSRCRASSKRCSTRSAANGAELDILVHSIAFAPKEDLQGGLLNCSADGLRQGDGRLLPFVRAHGAARRAADEERRHDVRDELPRREQGGPDLQRDGAGEGGARGLLPLPRLRARRQGHPRARDLARAAQDARRVRAQGLRPAARPRPRSARRSASWSTSWTSASPAPISRRRTRGACPARRSTSTAASTSWRNAEGGLSWNDSGLRTSLPERPMTS